jgi:GNAT superfamily N-acetyltransferase
MRLREEIERINQIMGTQPYSISVDEEDGEYGKKIRMTDHENNQIGCLNFTDFDKAIKIDPEFEPIINFHKNLYDKSNMIYFHTLEVDEKHRNKGYATKLLDYLKKYCLNNNMKYISLIANQNNRPARSLYDKLNYKEESYRGDLILYVLTL